MRRVVHSKKAKKTRHGERQGMGGDWKDKPYIAIVRDVSGVETNHPVTPWCS